MIVVVPVTFLFLNPVTMIPCMVKTQKDRLNGTSTLWRITMEDYTDG